MPQIPDLPAELRDKPGVAMTPPPVEYMEETINVIGKAVERLAPDQRGLLTVWVDTTAGVNAALVQRAGEHVELVAWVGKTWGKPLSAGIAGRIGW